MIIKVLKVIVVGVYFLILFCLYFFIFSKMNLCIILLSKLIFNI